MVYLLLGFNSVALRLLYFQIALAIAISAQDIDPAD